MFKVWWLVFPRDPVSRKGAKKQLFKKEKNSFKPLAAWRLCVKKLKGIEHPALVKRFARRSMGQSYLRDAERHVQLICRTKLIQNLMNEVIFFLAQIFQTGQSHSRLAQRNLDGFIISI